MPITYKNKKSLKNELVKRAKEHQAADRLVHGRGYFTGFNGDAKGCAIGCLATPLGVIKQKREFDLAQRTATNKLAREFGIPTALTLLAENIFESYPLEESNLVAGLWKATAKNGDGSWPTRFAKAIPVGVKLTNQDVRAFVVSCPDLRTPLYYGSFDTPEQVAESASISDTRRAANATLRWLRGLK